MNNRHLQATWAYHNGTKHSYQSVRASRHVLDWENQPILFKIYSTLEPIPLRRDATHSTVSALGAIAAGCSGAVRCQVGTDSGRAHVRLWHARSGRDDDLLTLGVSHIAGEGSRTFSR